MIKVMIADDQELIRQSLQIVLSTHEDLKIVDAVENGFAVLESIKKERPDVILMDIRMPEMDGVYCTKAVKEKYPDIKIIILTTFDDDEFVFSALKYGASGYLLKGVSMDELYHAICTVYNGGAMINPDIVCIGKATKVCGLLTDKDKTYRAVVKLGVMTNTEDMTGEILAKHPVSVTKEQIERAVSKFVGEIEQIGRAHV